MIWTLPNPTDKFSLFILNPLAAYSLLITHSRLKRLLPVAPRTPFSPDSPPPNADHSFSWPLLLTLRYPNLYSRAFTRLFQSMSSSLFRSLPSSVCTHCLNDLSQNILWLLMPPTVWQVSAWNVQSRMLLWMPDIYSQLQTQCFI